MQVRSLLGEELLAAAEGLLLHGVGYFMPIASNFSTFLCVHNLCGRDW